MANYKEVVIVGAGIAGLRAAWALVQDPLTRVLILDKSTSVGGRVATRRFGDEYVNHGAESFGGFQRVLAADPFAEDYLKSETFEGRATDLPKKMKEDLLAKFGSRVTFRFGWEVYRVIEEEILVSITGDILTFDHLILTAPVPQIEKMTGKKFPEIFYQKSILFLGVLYDSPVRIEMDATWSEKMFEESDEVIKQAAILEIKTPLKDLMLKKWRYARVSRGLKASYLELGKKIILAGDAFDPQGEFNLGASWMSGLNAGLQVLAPREVSE